MSDDVGDPPNSCVHASLSTDLLTRYATFIDRDCKLRLQHTKSGTEHDEGIT